MDLPPTIPDTMRRIKRMAWTSLLGGLFIVLAVLVAGFYWYIVRVEVGNDQFLVVMKKTGLEIPPDTSYGPDQVVLFPELVAEIAQKTGRSEEEVRNTYKGVRYETYAAGRHWMNPWYYERHLCNVTTLGAGEVGVLIRKFGRPLPPGKTVATEPDERGPVAEILPPGRHFINPLAYEVKRFPMLQIPEGHVGVVTLLHGAEPQARNTYTVAEGEQGVQPYTLPPGLEAFNPYVKQVQVVDVRSHRYDMLGDEAIEFPSKDSFPITIEGTIEWAIRPEKVAEISVAYGDQSDIVRKIILPNARSLARIQGSRLSAREFMSPKRQKFQDALLAELKRDCWQQGIEIKSALVRAIVPPAEIANLISKREQADQEIKKYENQIQEAAAEAQLVEQKELQARNRAVGEANQQVVKLINEAKQGREVDVTAAEQELAVAKLKLEAATKLAAATRARGEAEAKVVLFDYQARAEPLADAVAAFGGGDVYAQHFFLQKIAPAIRSVLSNTEGPMADIFRQFQRFDGGGVVPASQSVTAAEEGGQ